MNKFIAIYLAIRKPLLWVSLFITFICTGIVSWIALFIWSFISAFDESLCNECIECINKKKKNDKYIDD